jgi:hypothetical protein
MVINGKGDGQEMAGSGSLEGGDFDVPCSSPGSSQEDFYSWCEHAHGTVLVVQVCLASVQNIPSKLSDKRSKQC